MSFLPHGAERIALGDVRLIFRYDKLVLAWPDSDRHFTFHTGGDSGEVDIHLTSETSNPPVHRRLFSMSRENFLKFMVGVGGGGASELLGRVRPLRPGWMVRQRIGGVVGLIPTDEELVQITRSVKRKLVIDPEKLAGNVRVPEFIDDFYELPVGRLFTLVDWQNAKRPRQIGLGFRIVVADGSSRLRWIKYRDIRTTLRSGRPALIAAAEKYGTFHEPLPWKR